MNQEDENDSALRLRYLEKRLAKLEALLQDLQTHGRGIATKNDVRYVKEELQDFEAWTRGEIRALSNDRE